MKAMRFIAATLTTTLAAMCLPQNVQAYASQCGDFSFWYPNISLAHLVSWTPSEALTFERVAVQSIFDGGPDHYFDLFFNEWLGNIGSPSGHGYVAPYQGPPSIRITGTSMLYWYDGVFHYVADRCTLWR